MNTEHKYPLEDRRKFEPSKQGGLGGSYLLYKTYSNAEKYSQNWALHKIVGPHHRLVAHNRGSNE